MTNRATNASLLRYADALRIHGHRAASIDPLGLLQQERVAALEPSRYGLSDPDTTYDINGILWTAGEQAPEKRWTLRDITDFLNTTYVGRIAYEYMDLPSKTERLWFSHLLESQSTISTHDCSPARKQRIHELLARSEVLDTFLQSKFPNLKRYGLEGGESMLPALDALIGEAAQGVYTFHGSALAVNILILAGMTHIILAMPHRGRLNLLTGLLGYDLAALFHKIKGGAEVLVEGEQISGDVLSHLGVLDFHVKITSTDDFLPVASPTLNYDGKDIKLSLLPNPSHLGMFHCDT